MRRNWETIIRADQVNSIIALAWLGLAWPCFESAFVTCDISYLNLPDLNLGLSP